MTSCTSDKMQTTLSNYQSNGWQLRASRMESFQKRPMWYDTKCLEASHDVFILFIVGIWSDLLGDI